MSQNLEGKSSIGRSFVLLSNEQVTVETSHINPEVEKVVSNSGDKTVPLLSHRELMKQINLGNLHLNFCDRVDGVMPSGETVTAEE